MGDDDDERRSNEEEELEEGELPLAEGDDAAPSAGAGGSSHAESKADAGGSSDSEDEAKGRRKRRKLDKKEIQKQVKRVLNGKGTAKDYLDVYGADARAVVEIHGKSQPIQLQDIPALVNWTIGSGTNPSWIFIKNKPLIRKVVMLLVSGVDVHLWKVAQESFTKARKIFGDGAFATVTGLGANIRAGQTAKALLTLPMTKTEFKKQKKERKEAAMNRGPPFPPSHYALTLADMQLLGYPLPIMKDDGSLEAPEGFVASEPGDGSRDGKLVGLDCEMCFTAEGLELTRVTLVDEEGHAILDELVKPGNEITDYNTRYSGITAGMLQGVETTLEDVRSQVLKLVHDKTLLVGHSLENDLKAMKLLHANCLDTSFLFPHNKGPPFRSSLRFLSEKFLKKAIQAGTHDSVEDAATAMQLAKLKIKHGPNWGNPRGDWMQGDPLLEALAKEGRGCSLVASSKALTALALGSADAIVADTPEKSLNKMIAQANNETVDFVWGHWLDVTAFQAARAEARRSASTSRSVVLKPASASPGDTVDGDLKRVEKEAAEAEDEEPEEGEAPREKSGTETKGKRETQHRLQAEDEDLGDAGDLINGNKTLAEVLGAVDARIGRLWAGLPPGTMLVVSTGQGDTHECRRVRESRWRRSREPPLDGLPPWKESEEAALESLNEQTAFSVCLAAMRH